jgi:DNA end-binding protein Ku
MERSTKAIIKFNEINLDVKLSVATSREKIELKTISQSLNEIEQKTSYFDKVTKKECNKEDLLKGFKLSPQKYIPISDDDFNINKENVFEIEKFVPTSSIANHLVEKSYYVKPNDTGKTFTLLANCMEKKKVSGIGYFHSGKNKVLALITSYKGGIMFQPIYFKNEVRDYDNTLPDVRITNQDRQLFDKIVDNMTTKEFNHGYFRDYSKEEFYSVINKKKMKMTDNLTDTLKKIESKTSTTKKPKSIKASN